MRGLLVAAMLVGTSLPAVASPGRAVRVEHHIADDAPALGPHDALVTIELFFTPGQVGAHDAYRTLKDLQEKHPTRLRAVFRPLDRNTNTPEIVLVAHRRGLFFDLMNMLSAGSLGPSPAATVEMAVKVGISRSVVERAHLDEAVLNALDFNKARTKRLGINNNPEFVINGRPLGAALHAATATVDNLDLQYKMALDDARRAKGQGVPARVLALWGERRALCDDESFGGTPSPARGKSDDGEDDGEAKDHEPESFAWRLAEMLVRGTGCAIAQHMPSTLDEYNPDAPPRRNTTPLLAKALSPAGLPFVGPEDAAVPIFVVCNLRARYCQDQLDMARRIAENFPGQVRAVWVPWVDLALDGAENDLTLAQAVLCATAQGDGWKFLDAAGKAGVTGRSRVDLAVIATAAGLDADSLVACASAPPEDARAIVEAARAAGIGYGPTVVIGGRAYLGGFNEDRKVIARISAELAPGLLEALIPSW